MVAMVHVKSMVIIKFVNVIVVTVVMDAQSLDVPIQPVPIMVPVKIPPSHQQSRATSLYVSATMVGLEQIVILKQVIAIQHALKIKAYANPVHVNVIRSLQVQHVVMKPVVKISCAPIKARVINQVNNSNVSVRKDLVDVIVVNNRLIALIQCVVVMVNVIMKTALVSVTKALLVQIVHSHLVQVVAMLERVMEYVWIIPVVNVTKALLEKVVCTKIVQINVV